VTPTSHESLTGIAQSAKRINGVLGLAILGGFVLLVAGYWIALGSFMVTISAGPVKCGSPFSNRWTQNRFDTGTISDLLCGREASTRRLLTFVFVCLGITVFITVVTVVATIRRRSGLHMAAPNLRRWIGVSMIGLVAAVLLLAGALFAVVHVANDGLSPAAVARIDIPAHPHLMTFA
jgi:hypothetical protein